jgi:hypothetical protein
LAKNRIKYKPADNQGDSGYDYQRKRVNRE